MARDKEEVLKPNPFTTYRDPQTGKWVVIKPVMPKKTMWVT
jgi:hypothetical protein